jgi:Tfp pilus assembly protein PilN
VSLIVVLAAVGLTMAWWFFAVGLKTVAESALSTEQNRRDELTAKLATYSYILEARDAHERSAKAEAWATSTDVRWDAYLAQMLETLPPGVRITDIDVAQVSPMGAQRVPIEGPFNEADLGTIVLKGRADQPQLANDYIANLAPISGFYHVEISEMRIETDPTSEKPQWAFTLFLDISVDALSGRSIIAHGGAE